MNKKKLWPSVLTFLSAVICAGLVVGTFATLQFSQGLTDAKGIRDIELKIPLRVYSADGALISEFGNERRIPIDYEDTPETLINAVLASEDDNFFNHLGIDIFGLIRATLANVNSGHSGQGASTITMQVARNFFLSPEKTYTRKIKEILLAIRLELVLDKQEILSLYLNKIFLGHRSYGFGAAAEVYYGKPLADLNLAQTAMLAGLPKAPSSYNPIRNPQRAIIRRDYVLKRMHSLKWISDAQYKSAKAMPVTAKKHARETDLDAPHIAEMVRADLIEKYGQNIYWQGLNVYTTVSSEEQTAATQSLREGLQAYDRRHGYRGAVANVGLPSSAELTAKETSNIYEEALRPHPKSYEQTPALVLNIDTSAKNSQTDMAQIWVKDIGEGKLNFAQVKWAKKHINVNKVGPRPKKMTDVLSVGDIIYVTRLQNDKNQNPKTADWSLSQIPNVSGSLISIDPRSGAIISLVGGYDFFLNKYNRATQSIRQPGSNIKPFIYSASLEKGFTPASLVSGAPIVLTDPSHGTRWRPQNYSGKFFGPTRIRTALSKSMNLVSIRLLRAIGIPFAREYAERFGLDMSRFSNSLTMALGAGGVKPIEMISAYSVIANGGYKVKPYFIERITDRNGDVVFKANKPVFCDECIKDFFQETSLVEEPQETTTVEDSDTQNQEIAAEAPKEPPALELTPIIENISENTSTYTAPRVMTHANNILTTSMLKDVVNRGTARKALTLKRNDLAGKTGTTNDYVDAWFTGFNKQVATTVWVGFDQPKSMGRGESGSLAALPIWVDYMRTGLANLEEDDPTLPEYIESGFVNRNSGLRVSEGEPSSTPELFVIDELTPEYALQIKSNHIIASDENHQLDEQKINQNLFQDESALNSQTLNDNTDDQEFKVEERIIETDSDTEGLF